MGKGGCRDERDDSKLSGAPLQNADSLYPAREGNLQHGKVFFVLLLKKGHSDVGKTWMATLFSETCTKLIAPVLFLMYTNNLDQWVSGDLFNLGGVKPKGGVNGRVGCSPE